MEKISTIYELAYKDIVPNFECSSIKIEAFNLDNQEPETHFISFLELALMLSPEGKGCITVGLPFMVEDNKTGPTNDYKEIPLTPSEFLTEIFDESEKAFQMLTTMRQEYKAEIYNCIIEMLERKFLIKHNSVTC